MTVPFYRLSSFNRAGGKMHPIVSRRLNQVLDMWAAMMTVEDIAKSLDISPDTVREYVKRAKRRADPRAMRPRGIDRRVLKASVRRTQMKLLAKAGYSKKDIAKRLDCNVRLVQMRLREESTVGKS